MATKQRQRQRQKQKQGPTHQAISLKGSTEIVADFFKFAVNTYVSTSIIIIQTRECWNEPPTKQRILYQRGVYPSDDFHLVKKYGQVVMLTQDQALEIYLDKYVD